jgi:Transposase DDE domain
MDLDTFLTTVYVLVEDHCSLPVAPRLVGRPPAVSRGEVLTLAIASQWATFPTERAFYRYATRHLRALFPTLPSRPQFNRLLRGWHDALVAVGLQIADWLEGPTSAYQILDTTGIATRNKQRRGAGWLAGQADIGWCTRLRWFEGLRLLTVVSPRGVLTGYALAPASAGERAEATVLLEARATPHPDLPTAGRYTAAPYLADSGFYGQAVMADWRSIAQATVLAPPQQHAAAAWSRPVRRQHAGWRQIVETVHCRLLTSFRLERERPHTLRGIQARLAAKVALHNLCLWLNHLAGQPLLALATIIDW